MQRKRSVRYTDMYADAWEVRAAFLLFLPLSTLPHEMRICRRHGAQRGTLT